LNVEDFIKVFAAAVLAASFTLAVTWLKATRDDLRLSADYFIKVLADAADAASAYWLLPGTNPEAALLGVRLIGFQERLSRLRLTTFAPFRQVDRNILDEDLLSFFDACTGGRHGEKNRPIDANRAREAQAVAARIDAHMRTGVQTASKLRSYLARRLLPVGSW
jgi:hypothetical protein